MEHLKLSRRGFIRTTVAAGGGLLLGFHVPIAGAATVAPQPWTTPTEGVEINAWLTIDHDGTVTIRVPHTEMGQGGLTSVAMMIAEELDVDWSKVQAVFADMNRHIRNNDEYVVTSTHGSQLVRSQHPHIMQAGASARERLKEAAARAWGVDRSQVIARQGMLSAGDRTASYADFATAAARVELDREPSIKTPDQWWLLGRPIRRIDVPVKVNGSATYASDIRLPGMVYAAVKSCPVPWGGLRSFDFDAIRDRPGVIAAIELKAREGQRGLSDMHNGVAVVADSWWRAKTGLDLMPIEWELGRNGSVTSDGLLAAATDLLDRAGTVTREEGQDTLAKLAGGKRVVTADYHRPYEAHARMEPPSATVSVSEDRVDVWSPTQNQATALMLVADQTGFDPKDVYVHTVFLGGGFGGNGPGNTAVTRQAAELSRQLRRPVKVIWTREEDILQGKQRAPHLGRFSAALGDDGLPVALLTRAAWVVQEGGRSFGGGPDRAIGSMPYRVPARRHETHAVTSHIPIATHRAPVANQNGFMTECFVDEMALAGGWDPLDWRIAMTEGLNDWQLVLRTLKDKSGFTTDLPRGRGMGVAVVESHGSICGACATVDVSREGHLEIEKMVIVIDSGHVINPQGAAEQLEGSVCWELSHALFGGLELRDGRFTNTNFDTYRLLRIDRMPEVECHFALSGGRKWGGIGEPGVPPVPPAVANAIYFATGKRVRSTPFEAHDLSWS
jgi:isoquinoline 1-oxidoreductase beta subunit